MLTKDEVDHMSLGLLVQKEFHEEKQEKKEQEIKTKNPI